MVHTLELPDGVIAYDDSGGDGPLMIAVPGMGDLRGVYRHVAPLLVDAGFRVVTMDVRGMGESSIGWPVYDDSAVAADILALIDHLNAGPAIVIGNSFSCGSAVIAATDRPAAVSHLVLIGPFVREVPIPWWQAAAFRVMLRLPGGRRAWVAYYRTKMFPLRTPPDHDEYTAGLAAVLAEPGRFAAFREQASDSHAAAGSRLADVRAPVLIVMGTADPDFPDPVAEAHLLADRMGGEVELVDGAGHYPQAEVPDRVSAAIEAFYRNTRVA